MMTSDTDDLLDLLVVGVGPPALVGLYEAKQAGLRALGVDKGPVCGALVRHPAYMRWFSTADKLELAGYPLLVSEKSPTRREYLKYCRAFVRQFDLDIATYHEVTGIARNGDCFVVTARDLHGRPCTWRAAQVAVGTGFYDSPRPLNVPGEDLPHVSHTYTEAHAYFGQKVLVIGGGSSAAEYTLELWREGIDVSVAVRGAEFHTKYWVKPDIENRIEEGSIPCYYDVAIKEILPDEVVLIDRNGEEIRVETDFVLAMTGYEPDTTLLQSIGAEVDPVTKKPTLNEHYETTVPGLYVIGTICAGVESNVVFIENSREHGPTIVRHILEINRERARSSKADSSIGESVT